MGMNKLLHEFQSCGLV